MNARALCSAWILLLVSIGFAAAAAADSAEASCEVHVRGETAGGQSGPCSFSQRQGHIGIDLRNGDRWELDPTGRPNEFLDQKRVKVTRSFQRDDHVYTWPHKQIIVRFGVPGGKRHASEDAAMTPSCEVRVRGDLASGQSGPCSFSQRQGHISIDLRNGDRWELDPTGQTHQFRDQKGTMVARSFQGDDHVYTWPHKQIIVSFGGQDGGGHGSKRN